MRVTDHFENRPTETDLVLSGVSVVLNTEHTLQLYIDRTLVNTFVCSPADLGALCTGWLLTEGYGAASVEVAPDGETAVAQGVSGQIAAPERCCVSAGVNATPEEMLKLFREASSGYDRSHGVHECVLKGSNWHITATDIGRHNAIDKAVGAAIVAGYDLQGAVMFTSGRINVQTVKKALRCGISCLMSKAVITGDALALAQQLGLKILFSVKETGYITI